MTKLKKKIVFGKKQRGSVFYQLNILNVYLLIYVIVEVDAMQFLFLIPYNTYYDLCTKFVNYRKTVIMSRCTDTRIEQFRK